MFAVARAAGVGGVAIFIIGSVANALVDIFKATAIDVVVVVRCLCFFNELIFLYLGLEGGSLARVEIH